MCKIAVGVVGGNAGSRHVANVIVGGWYEKRRSVQRHVRVLPPRDNIVICGAAMREAGAVSGARYEVLGAKFKVTSNE